MFTGPSKKKSIITTMCLIKRCKRISKSYVFDTHHTVQESQEIRNILTFLIILTLLVWRRAFLAYTVALCGVHWVVACCHGWLRMPAWLRACSRDSPTVYKRSPTVALLGDRRARWSQKTRVCVIRVSVGACFVHVFFV